MGKSLGLDEAARHTHGHTQHTLSLSHTHTHTHTPLSRSEHDTRHSVESDRWMQTYQNGVWTQIEFRILSIRTFLPTRVFQ